MEKYKGGENIEERPEEEKVIDESINETEEEKAQKVFLSEEQKDFSLKQIMELHKISKATASRARKNGYFWKGYHEHSPFARDFSNTDVQDTGNYKNVIFLKDYERKLPVSKLSKLYNLGLKSALSAKKKGG